jgi:cytochrome c-type biogenesis protein
MTNQGRKALSTGSRLTIAALLAAAGLFGVLQWREVAVPHAGQGPQAAAACSSGPGGACVAPVGTAPVDDPSVQTPQGKARILEFQSAYCPSCARMATVMRDVEQRCSVDADTILPVAVDEPRGEALAARYGVRAVPTFVRVDARGEEVERSVGEQPRERLAHMLGKVRGVECTAL